MSRLTSPTSTAGLRSRPAWFAQVFSDLQRHEGFRQHAYPDPLSKIGRAFPAGKKYRWGFRPATEILGELGINPSGGRPWTVGYGFTHGVSERSFVSKEYADRKLESEIHEHVAGLDRLTPGWRTDFPVVVQTVVANLIYNMGTTTLSTFKATLNLLNTAQFKAAGENLKRTKWHKQVGSRAIELENRLITGKIEPENKV